MFVLAKPGKPKNISIIGIGSDFVEFTWMAPDILGNPNLTHYNIRLATMEATTTDTTFYIEALLPGQTYTVYVKAVSDFFFDGGDIGNLVFETELSSKLIFLLQLLFYLLTFNVRTRYKKCNIQE